MAIAGEKVVAVLLAAGRSSRFGSDKLAYPFRGKPLAAHAADAMSAIPFLRRIAVIGEKSAIDFAASGFETVRAPPGALMSASLQTGIAAAANTDCEGCLIALADMPFVPAQHFRNLLAAHQDGITATALGSRHIVPAVFSRSDFGRLRAVERDEGARALLQAGRAVLAAESWLRDIDTPADLASIEAGHRLRRRDER